MTIRVKICGLKEPEHVVAAAEAGAAYVGFVFFKKSPRNVSLERACLLAKSAPDSLTKVALTVNADDTFLENLLTAVPLDMLQLHGSESPERVAEVRSRFGLPVMKAIGIADAEDVAKIDTYGAVADQLLVDAKPPKNADLPGGNGLSFDWRLVNREEWPRPWMLAGGLTVDNVAEAIQMTGAQQLDLSSGVESAPGLKDIGLIQAFMKAALSAV
ncbi:phosphoribosylanthranilate isomerase [Shimia sp. MMG029]|uniref:phosphoribosylanthranilate isomerase n=1 Tax=Shimia sp. MMG029 TaxID=3021978 RepID=UPI0022FF1142|nr:phosphoribosylanthranilate isomerase [Shimia sp. MMG029]MDA5555305.1 phosphoribosylanthranilate isomerase [Shimia sp. MMG029]